LSLDKSIRHIKSPRSARDGRVRRLQCQLRFRPLGVSCDQWAQPSGKIGTAARGKIGKLAHAKFDTFDLGWLHTFNGSSWHSCRSHTADSAILIVVKASSGISTNGVSSDITVVQIGEPIVWIACVVSGQVMLRTEAGFAVQGQLNLESKREIAIAARHPTSLVRYEDADDALLDFASSRWS
jgi:hypothetical protein